MTFAFHDGERAVQARAGETMMAAHNSGIVTDTVMPGARLFIEKQVMVATSTRDGAGQIWASLLFGPAGFLSSPDVHSIAIQMGSESRMVSDPFWQSLDVSSRVGLLFIELATRRRYRVNGQVERLSSTSVRLSVAEAFPNCPKYIQRRRACPEVAQAAMPDSGSAETGLRGGELAESVADLLKRADTLFIGSGAPGGQLDASHRGGPRGFIQVVGPRLLRVPDYAGNSMFNTLGNLALDPACGLVVPDFEGGWMLHLTGRAKLIWDAADPQGATGGTGRFWEFEIDEWLLRDASRGLAWEYQDASPFLPRVRS